MLQKIRKSKKGFTLVEVIVVLVILAILAAILIPSMTGWIDEANKKTAVTEARTMLLAAQTVASEQYAVDTTKTTKLASAQIAAAQTLSGIGATFIGDVGLDAKYTITSFVVKTTTGKYVTYTGPTATAAATYSVSDTSSSNSVASK